MKFSVKIVFDFIDSLPDVNLSSLFLLSPDNIQEIHVKKSISQYRRLFGFFLLFCLICLTAQPSYEGRAAVEEGK
jgi:hypothetical protein